MYDKSWPKMYHQHFSNTIYNNYSDNMELATVTVNIFFQNDNDQTQYWIYFSEQISTHFIGKDTWFISIAKKILKDSIAKDFIERRPMLFKYFPNCYFYNALDLL